ncbi:MAG: hypothetical protein ACI81P_002207 [Neolewinella sp.]|jgi:hypothetical protein
MVSKPNTLSLGIEGSWNTLSANLTPHIGCAVTLVLEADFNSSSEEMAIGNIVFTQGSIVPTMMPIVCPTVGSVTANTATVCTNDPFNVTGTGLANTDNNEQDFGIRFVAFTSIPADPYLGGTTFGTIPFGSLTGGGTTASFDPTDAAPAGGNITVTCTFTNGNGCTDAATDDIFVNPICNEPPVAICQTVTVNANTNCEATVAAEAFDGGSSDPDMDLLTFPVSPAGPYSLGTTSVVLTVEDGLATDTCQTTITVSDVAPPAAVCQDVTILLDNAGNGSITAADVDNGSFDNCDANPSLALSQTTFDCNHLLIPPNDYPLDFNGTNS